MVERADAERPGASSRGLLMASAAESVSPEAAAVGAAVDASPVHVLHTIALRFPLTRTSSSVLLIPVSK